MTQMLAKTCVLMITADILIQLSFFALCGQPLPVPYPYRNAEEGNCHAIIGVPTTQFACQYNKMDMNECVTTNITLKYASSNDLSTHVHILYKTY